MQRGFARVRIAWIVAIDSVSGLTAAQRLAANRAAGAAIEQPVRADFDRAAYDRAADCD